MISTLGASAQVVTSAEVKATVAKILEDGYKKISDGDVEVKVSATQFAQLQLPDGKITYKAVAEAFDFPYTPLEL